jgi:hypothetical protein
VKEDMVSASLHGSKTSPISSGIRTHGSMLYAVLLAVAVLWPAWLLVGAITGSTQVLWAAVVAALVAPTLVTGLAALGWWGNRRTS